MRKKKQSESAGEPANQAEFGWSDIAAMAIAAMQLLIAPLAVIAGALLLVYILFRLWLH